MSLLFVNYDRTHMCNHTGMLLKPAKDGTRMCARCGKSVQPTTPRAETFTQPAGPKASRLR